MRPILKTAIIYVTIIVVGFLLWALFQPAKLNVEMIPFSTFLDWVAQDRVEGVVIRGADLRGETRTSDPRGRRDFGTVVPASYPPMYDLMRSKGVIIELEEPRESRPMTALITWVPVIFLIGLWIFFMRMMKRRQEPPSAAGRGP